MAARWAAPAPVHRVRGSVVNGTTFGPSCHGIDPASVEGGVSEECLNLNVWSSVPTEEQQQRGKGSTAALAPVLVWLHGGCFTGGSANEQAWNATNLIEHLRRQGRPAVVVTVNFRLGVFGHLASDALRSGSPGSNSTGNYAMQDQREALRWVRTNIAAFGGNPDRVLLWGHSSGAASVMFHLASPLSRGLFSAAAALSGSLGNWAALDWRAAEANWQMVLSRTSCRHEALQCLRNLSADELYNATRTDDPKLYAPCRDGCPWALTIDGVELTDYPWRLLGRRRADDSPVAGAAVPLLHGSMLDDGFDFVDENNFFNLSTSRADAASLNRYTSEAFGPHLASEDVLSVYGPACAQFNNATAAATKVTAHFWCANRIETDFAFFCPALRTSRAYGGSGGRDASAPPVYQYRFAFIDTSVPPTQRMIKHGDELKYIWRNNATALAAPGAELLSSRLISYLWNLASVGDPNGDGTDGLQHWPRFDVDDKGGSVLVLDAAMQVANISREADRCSLWDKHWANDLGTCVPEPSVARGWPQLHRRARQKATAAGGGVRARGRLLRAAAPRLRRRSRWQTRAGHF